MIRRVSLIFVMLAAVACAQATPYWISYDPSNGLPEDCGWERGYGDWEGPNHGSGAVRTIQNGVLTYDSLADPGIYDYNYMYRFGQVDPGPQEQLVMAWRLKVDAVDGSGDPGIAFFSDSAWAASFTFAQDHIRSVFENYLSIPFAPGVWHDYCMVTSDLRTFDLFIDNHLAHHGALRQVVTESFFSWGDGVQGSASLHDWQYVRYGVTPEPPMLLMLPWLLAWHVARRR